MKVFISYRRGDTSLYLVPDLRAALVGVLGEENVFLDIDIPLGVDFRSHIRGEVDRADAVLVLIGPQWGQHRLSALNDFVRMEILAAEELGKLIVPVLVAGRAMPQVAEIPDELQFLCYRNASAIAAPPRHRDDITRLATHFGGLRSAAPRPESAVPSPTITKRVQPTPPHRFAPANAIALHILTGHTSGVYGCAYSPDGTQLATTSADDTVRIWGNRPA